jgi:hypothetical protein
MHPYHHALSSAKKWGGVWQDYIKFHNWFDVSKAVMGDVRHRALRHHTVGIFELEHEFGITMTNSDLKEVPIRYIGEQHVREDLGWIPTVKDWFEHIPVQTWMIRVAVKAKDIEKDDIQNNKETTTVQGRTDSESRRPASKTCRGPRPERSRTKGIRRGGR